MNENLLHFIALAQQQVLKEFNDADFSSEDELPITEEEASVLFIAKINQTASRLMLDESPGGVIYRLESHISFPEKCRIQRKRGIDGVYGGVLNTETNMTMAEVHSKLPHLENPARDGLFVDYEEDSVSLLFGFPSIEDAREYIRGFEGPLTKAGVTLYELHVEHFVVGASGTCLMFGARDWTVAKDVTDKLLSP